MVARRRLAREQLEQRKLNPADLAEGLARHGIDEDASFEELVDETYRQGWALQLWGAPWRNASELFTCKLFAQQEDGYGRKRAQHILKDANTGAAWVAEGATARIALGRALVMTLDVLFSD